MKTPPLMATFLVAANAWFVTFGEQIITLEDKSGPLGRHFADLDELDYCLGLCGLYRGKGNRIALVGSDR